MTQAKNETLGRVPNAWSDRSNREAVAAGAYAAPSDPPE